ncbi:MAG: DEAD/DEAH box helicase [Halobacteriaceae archaeon]
MAATEDPAYVEHPMLADGVIERRTYQTDLAATAREAHTLVCLPTGLGKTAVSALVTADRLAADAGGRALLLAPTKPLVEQHAADYREWFTVPDDEVVVFTGEVRPEDRADLWEGARVVVATPQVVENDLVGGRISLRDVVHLTFDECHRATGDYAYTYIAERYHADAADPLVTGMSASPGGDREAILQVCENLGVREIAVKTEEDADVAAHTYATDVEWERVELPDAVREIRDALNEVIVDRLERLQDLGVTRSTDPQMSETDLAKMGAKLRELIDQGESAGYEGMSLHAEVRKLRTAVTYVETQSVESVRRYFERQRNAASGAGASKASQRLVSDPNVKRAMRLAEEYDDLHPKYRRARMLLAETLGIRGGERVIVFTESRDTAEALTSFLGGHFETRKFVGQGDREGSDGMTQTQQKETLEAFRSGEFEVLVSTSVAEEGLDVPEVDLVLFYEPVPTAIRSVQRKGRTGRQSEGRVVVLLAEDTRDEAYFWISRRRETEMREELRELQSMADDLSRELDQATLDQATGGGASAEGPASVDGEGAGHETGSAASAATDPSDDGEVDAGPSDDGGDDAGGDGEGSSAGGQVGLTDFAADVADDGGDGDDDAADDAVRARAGGEDEAVEVVVDQRELDSTIARDLSKRDAVDVRLETLDVGDYVLSDRVVVERKTTADFLDSLVGGDRSVFEQVGEMARHYARPVVVVEGGDLYGERNVHPNAVRGALASLAVDFGASVLRTSDAADTADLLALVAEREQTTSDREVSVHGEKASKTLAEQQEYVVSSIADVGPVTARSLLEHFGSVEATLTASEEALLAVAGVGEVTAGRIREVVASDYPDA